MMEEKKSTYSGYTDARRRATQKYLTEKHSRVYVWLKKEKKEELKRAAERCGLSTNQFVAQAIEEKIERDGLST